MNVSTSSDYHKLNKSRVSSKKYHRSSSQKLIRPYSANINSSKVSYHNYSVSNSNDSNKTFVNVFNVSNMSKTKLYEETLQLKNQINRIQKDIALAKTENLKIENEINQKEKAIENVNNKIDYFDKLKDDNEISKLKDKFREIKSELNEQIEENEKIKNDIKRINISNLTLIQEQKLEKLKNIVNEYYKITKINADNEKIIEEYKEKIKVFNSNHHKIKNMKDEIEKSKKNIHLMNREIRNLTEQIKNNENKIKKEKLNIKNLKQLNERLLYEKKNREDYIHKKPILQKQIDDLQNKLKEYKKQSIRNEQELNKINEQNSKLKNIPEKKSFLSVKPLNYDLYVQIDKNPEEEESEKVRLLESLIKESKKRQNEYLDIISYYDDYAKQKKMYDRIKDDDKTTADNNENINVNEGETNNNNNNNNNAHNQDNENNLNNKEKNNDSNQKKEINNENLINNDNDNKHTENNNELVENEKESKNNNNDDLSNNEKLKIN